jgi:hypothetical protein
LTSRSGARLSIPVALPPGRARLAKRPTFTPSWLATTTIGMVLVAFFAANPPTFAAATITSGFH